jgi:hypothetical protein
MEARVIHKRKLPGRHLTEGPEHAPKRSYWKYAQGVGPARQGAVTHPGGTAETVSYADL